MRQRLARVLRSAIGLLVLLGVGACSTAPPAGLYAVTPFAIERYAGRWYEIARLDHGFERGMSDVSANYRIDADGSVAVINRGYDTRNGNWRQAVGRALFTGDPATASLKVSFFGPFYGGYHVVALDQQDYQWALVVGPDRGYFWILARARQLPDALRGQLIDKARAMGIAVDQLIWVEHTRRDD